MSSMKTLLLSEIFPPTKGGSGRWFWEIYTRLSPEHYVVCAGKHDEAHRTDKTSPLKTYRLDLSSDSWGVISLSGLLFYVRIFLRIRSIIKKETITRIHCGRSLPEGFIAWLIKKLLGIPYITYVHGEDVETARTSRELTWIVNNSLRGAEKIICNSHNSKQLLIDNWNIPEAQIVVMHPGVDCEKFIPLSERDRKSERPAAWKNRTVLLTVGRLQKRKGHDMLIKSLKNIKQEVPDILYCIIGEGEEKSNLERLVEENDLSDVVQFVGEISDEDMLLHYQCCDLFILPNRTVVNDIEGFGIVMLEAQACGVAVVAGDSGGTRETMSVGETGWIVDCSNTSSLEKELPLLISEAKLTPNIADKARNHVVGKFSWPQLAEQAKDVFQ